MTNTTETNLMESNISTTMAILHAVQLTNISFNPHGLNLKFSHISADYCLVKKSLTSTYRIDYHKYDPNAEQTIETYSNTTDATYLGGYTLTITNANKQTITHIEPKISCLLNGCATVVEIDGLPESVFLAYTLLMAQMCSFIKQRHNLILIENKLT